MNDVMNIQYQYIPGDPDGHYVANISMAWVEGDTYAAMAIANKNLTSYNVPNSAVVGYIQSLNMTPLVPEWGVPITGGSVLYFNGSLTVSSRNPILDNHVVNEQYQFIPGDPNNSYVANVSMIWVDAVTYAAMAAANAAKTSYQVPNSAVVGYITSLNMSPIVPEWGVDGPYFNGSLSVASLSPIAYRATNINMGGPKGSIQRAISGRVLIQYAVTGISGRDVNISLVWVSSATIDTWKTASNTFTPITVGGVNLIIAPGNGLTYQPMQNEWDASSAPYFSASISGIVT